MIDNGIFFLGFLMSFATLPIIKKESNANIIPGNEFSTPKKSNLPFLSSIIPLPGLKLSGWINKLFSGFKQPKVIPKTITSADGINLISVVYLASLLEKVLQAKFKKIKTVTITNAINITYQKLVLIPLSVPAQSGLQFNIASAQKIDVAII